MATRDEIGSEALFQEWNLLDDRMVWQGPVEDWFGLPANRLASGAAFAGLLGTGGADRMAAIRDAAASSSGLFEARYELATRRASFVVQERGKCVSGPDGRLAIVRSRLSLSAEPFDVASGPARVDGIAPRSVFFDRLQRLSAEGQSFGLLHVEPVRREDGVVRLLLETARPILRHGDQAAPFNETSVLLTLRGTHDDQIAHAARQLQARWSAGDLILSAIAAPKYGRTPALLLHRLLNIRDMARARSAAGLLSHSEQVAGRDTALRRVALGDELVAALNARAIRLAPRVVRQGGALLGLDLVAWARLDSREAELAPMRPLYARLDVAEAIDHRIAELGLARALTATVPVCIFLSSLTAASGWLDLVETIAAREGGMDGRLVVDLPAHEPASRSGEMAEIVARLRQSGCGFSLSGIRAPRDGVDTGADIFRFSPLALGDLAYSADARLHFRRMAAELQAQGGIVAAPPTPGREAALFLKSCGVALVEEAVLNPAEEAPALQQVRAA